MRRRSAGTNTAALERKIDEAVYGLYGLTPEEIALVEGRAASTPSRPAPASSAAPSTPIAATPASAAAPDDECLD